MKAIINGSLILEDRVLKDRILLFDQSIIDIVERIDFNKNIDVIDARGYFVSPGFINLHIHGCNGYDVMDENSIEEISKAMLKTGVTSFLATTMSMDIDYTKTILNQIREYMKNSNKYSKVLGVHLEGPFLNKNFRGCHDTNKILTPSFEIIEEYIDIVKHITIAPEIENANTFIKKATEKGIVISIGHTSATYDQTLAAIEQGAKHTTHTFNAMVGLHHRNPGVLAAVLLDDRVTCELIPDYVHLHPAIIKIILHLKGPNKVVLVTDSMKACLLGEGIYEFGGLKVIVKEKKATLEDGTIAGSVLPMNIGVKNYLEITNLPIYECIKAASLNPAKVLNIEDKYGSIKKGKYADLIIFDEHFNIKEAIVEGRTVINQ